MSLLSAKYIFCVQEFNPGLEVRGTNDNIYTTRQSVSHYEFILKKYSLKFEHLLWLSNISKFIFSIYFISLINK